MRTKPGALKPLPLHGVPITIKGSIEVEGFRCECGTKLRQGVVAERTAPLVTRLQEAGAIVIGTTNTPEFLMAYESDNFLYDVGVSPTGYRQGRISGSREMRQRLRRDGAEPSDIDAAGTGSELQGNPGTADTCDTGNVQLWNR